jgi:PKD repeat protein
VADDHGDSETAATPLAASGNGTTASLSTSGLISLRDDVDVFSFVSGAGPFSLSVDPAPFAPNLDIRAELYDSAGGLVASSNPADSLPAVLSGTLAAGEYFLFVDGVGKGDPLGTGYTDYGSLGRYAVAGTVADPGGLAAPVAAIATAYQPDYAPADVSLDGSGSNDSDGTVEIWDWDFGDGNSGTGVTALHQYAAPGEYTVTLTVTDDDGLTGSDSITVTVLNRAPVAVASASSTGGQAPLPVAFTGSSSYDPDNLGAITTWAWDFGDGASADTADADHTYNSAGTFVASLTVTDNRGDSDSATVTVSVSPPALLDQYASADEFGAGTVSGSYLDTHDLDDSVETILERESGGRKSSRYSYLEHAWLFNVAPGDLVTLAIAAWQDSSSDGDQMGFEYSLNGGDYIPVGIELGTSPVDAATEIALPPDIAAAGGALRVRVVDSDQTANNRSLDAVYVDQIVVRTENQGGGTLPPEPASGLAATAISSSRIDLAWLDGSTTETGFRIERSQDGVPWAEVATVGANVASFSDQGLKAATTYFYRVWSFNSAGDATVASNTDQGTTAPASAITLSASGYKVKGIQYVDLNWGGADGADVYRDSALVATVNAGNSYTDNIGAKGGGSYSYQVCEKGTSDCSAEEAVVF